VKSSERGVERRVSVGQDIPDEEEQHADGECVQKLAQTCAGTSEPADWQTNQDRNPRYEPKNQRLDFAQICRPLP